MTLKSILKGAIGMASLLVLYFSILTLVSGWSFAKIQFFQNWYWIIGLAFGFGVQIALFSYLRAIHAQKISGKAVAVSGTTSGIAMVACCSHYLINIVPIIGITAFATIIGQYQTELFLLGLASNLAGIGYFSSKLINRSSTAINH